MEQQFQGSPNNANPTIFGPLNTLTHVQQGLGLLGLSAPEELPAKWNWNEKIKLLPPSNQLMCGNCWAQSSTNALTDKFLTLHAIKGLELNQLITTICTFHDYGGQTDVNKECGGGAPYVAGKWFEKVGGVQSEDTSGNDKPGCPPGWAKFCQEQGCTPPPPKLPSCSQFGNCIANYHAEKDSTTTLTVQKNGQIDPNATVANIKQAIMNTGPVVGTFHVMADFEMGVYPAMGYKWNATNGIYINGSYQKDLDDIWNKLSQKSKLSVSKGWNGNGQRPPGPWGSTPLGYHAVEVVGWDSTGDVPYWIVKNSWGGEWADKGYWNHAMWPRNKTILMDVPASFASDSGSGGCTNFKFDPNSGPAYGTRVGSADSGGEQTIGGISKGTWKVVMWIVIGILAAIIIFVVAKKLFGRKRGGSYS